MFNDACTLYNVYSTMYIVQCILYNVYYTMYIVKCLLYNVYCTHEIKAIRGNLASCIIIMYISVRMGFV